MSGNEIPLEMRVLVKQRAHEMCERCAGRGAHWHHRRSRRVVDEHRHCPCNGVYLCGPCHAWAHTNPEEAGKTGWMVSQFEPWPGAVKVSAFYGSVTMTCLGGVLRI